MRGEMITNHQIPDHLVLEILRPRVHAMCHQETACDGVSPGPKGLWSAYHLSSPLGATARAPAGAPLRAASAVLPSRLAPPRDRAHASPGCCCCRPERRRCCSRGCGATLPTATSTRPDATMTRRRSEVSRRALSSPSCPWCGAIEVLGKVDGAELSAGWVLARWVVVVPLCFR
jgi:hypothetical protein